MIFTSVNLTCASGETEAVPKDQTSDQPDVQMKEQVETDNQSEEQQVSANLISDGVEVNKKQLMKEVRRPVSGFSAKPKPGA